MQIGIPRESLKGETRVAATPATVEQLQKLGFSVLVESNAGQLANFNDATFEAAGATISEDTKQVWASDIVLKVNAPANDKEIKLLQKGTTLISFIWPAQNEELLEKLAKRDINVLAMDSVPRISRSQSLDALSSMANIAGYRAVIEAANEFGRFFTGQITAAGKVPPAKVLIIGAGVAGLSAVGAAGSLGAIVRAYDTRPEVKEQITSLGAEFLEVDFDESAGSGDGYAKVMSEDYKAQEQKMLAEQVADADIIITTALIPGRPAPRLISQEMVDAMKAGSVIVDLAAVNGGNVEPSVVDKVITTDGGVKVIGYNEMARRLPAQASQLYGTNLVNLLKLLTPEKDGEMIINFDDVVQRGVTVIKDGEITWPAPPIQVSAAPQAAKKEEVKEAPAKPEKKKTGIYKALLAGGGIWAYSALANYVPAEFLNHLMVFALACVIGYYLIWDVAASLHTPLMSVTNAISGIVILGAFFQMGAESGLVTLLAFLGTFIATINIAGGFAVTERMLKMFRK
ncbi:Re/Si-specific NAD(P)(+) transhydrogenase subunit alpha [Moritella sp.]|uniref:Re/Si-specific NAD(P)(+) transhydrogenase subunit alpha n=1 Tax=Moritella sp. TaxID=78556 RepID=UPI001D9484A6|nr:Re/Si-specific NAD(P)(+) transhydrogenase subunit alpha [Moritella sp.]MCJ8351760.1 Re/Si-specific NAD(P)(+) transhydrogenase subunit alpha [Moritella sp.]NQZ39139.1 Re/Si-specific NAD(P)(+) transhydrogenase subunit alpha [Moritella sp.]